MWHQSSCWDWMCPQLAKELSGAGCCGPECGPWWLYKDGNMHCLGRKMLEGCWGHRLPLREGEWVCMGVYVCDQYHLGLAEDGL